MNSREKGKRGERQWRDELRANGYAARRGQQFSGSPDSPDVVCDSLSWIHFEVKAVERLNIEDAMEQARRDSEREVISHQSSVGKVPIVAHRRSFRPWLVTMEAETFFRLIRGDFTEGNGGNGEKPPGNGTNGQPQMADGKGVGPAAWPQGAELSFGDAVAARGEQATVPTNSK
jgi:Holliday junction resolvase